MTCPHCGTSNPDAATTCVNCGKPLHQAGVYPPEGNYTPPPPPPPAYTPPPSQPAYTPPPPPGPAHAAGPPAGVPPGSAGPLVYLILSILMIFCCCNPVAIVPLIFAIMALSRRSAGDYTGASVNGGRAALWFWISVVALIIWYTVFFGFMGGMATIEEIRRSVPQ